MSARQRAGEMSEGASDTEQLDYDEAPVDLDEEAEATTSGAHDRNEDNDQNIAAQGSPTQPGEDPESSNTSTSSQDSWQEREFPSPFTNHDDGRTITVRGTASTLADFQDTVVTRKLRCTPTLGQPYTSSISAIATSLNSCLLNERTVKNMKRKRVAISEKDLQVWRERASPAALHIWGSRIANDLKADERYSAQVLLQMRVARYLAKKANMSEHQFENPSLATILEQVNLSRRRYSAQMSADSGGKTFSIIR